MTLPTTSSASTTAPDCIPYWATCRPPPTNGAWQQKNLSLCLNLLDHYSFGRGDFERLQIFRGWAYKTVPALDHKNGRTPIE